MNVILWASLAISIGVPSVLFTAVYRMLWRERVSIRTVALCLLWGIVAFGITSWLNQSLLNNLPPSTVLARLVAPISETVLGSLFLFWLLYRRQIPNYVAGAAYGTASMITFAILNNTAYILGSDASTQILSQALLRVATTNNIFAISGAMAGFGMGMVRFEQQAWRKSLWVIGGLAVAVVWHGMFNNLVATVQSADLYADAVIFAAGGVGLMQAVVHATKTRHAIQELQSEKKRADDLINVVIPLGVSLSAERDFTHMLETIVQQARQFSNSDGASLYLRTADETLQAVVVINQSLGIFSRGSAAQDVLAEPLALADAQGAPVDTSIAAYVVNHGQSLNIPDVYTFTPEFPGPREFDRKMNYHTTSCLCLPLTNNVDKAIGALQLINARSPLTRDAVPFDPSAQQSLESLSALASAALTSYVRTEALRRDAQDFKLDQNKVAQQVAEITDSEFFTTLRDNVKKMREQKSEHKADVAVAGS